MNADNAIRRLVRANAEYARKIAVLRRAVQDARVLLRRADADVPRVLDALDQAYRASFNPPRQERHHDTQAGDATLNGST